ncbi:hypothetical protein KIPB_006130, partial [Kipferlia bialata]|eukprot:g6130.t1
MLNPFTIGSIFCYVALAAQERRHAMKTGREPKERQSNKKHNYPSTKETESEVPLPGVAKRPADAERARSCEAWGLALLVVSQFLRLFLGCTRLSAFVASIGVIMVVGGQLKVLSLFAYVDAAIVDRGRDEECDVGRVIAQCIERPGVKNMLCHQGYRCLSRPAVRVMLYCLPVYIYNIAVCCKLAILPNPFCHALCSWLLNPDVLDMVRREVLRLMVESMQPNHAQRMLDSSVVCTLGPHGITLLHQIMFNVAFMLPMPLRRHVAKWVLPVQMQLRDRFHVAAKLCKYYVVTGRTLEHVCHHVPYAPEPYAVWMRHMDQMLPDVRTYLLGPDGVEHMKDASVGTSIYAVGDSQQVDREVTSPGYQVNPSLPLTLFRKPICVPSEGRLTDFLYEYRNLLADTMSRFEACNVSVRAFLSFVFAIRTGYNRYPHSSCAFALDAIHLTHHLVHSVRASRRGVILMSVHQSFFALLAALCSNLGSGITDEGRMHVSAFMHRTECNKEHTAGVSLVVAKSTGLIDKLPMGSGTLLKQVLLDTSPIRILRLTLEVKHCADWVFSMSKEEQAEVEELSRPQIEDVLPSVLSVPHSVMGSLQSLLLRAREIKRSKRFILSSIH